MSYTLNTFVNCEDLQDRINDHFLCDRQKTLAVPEASLVQFAFSPANTRNTLQNQVASGDGKLKTVNLVYTPRIPAGAVDTTITPDDCTATVKQGQRTEAYTLDENEGVQISRLISTEDLIRFCRSNALYVEETIMQMMDAAILKMDKIIAADAIALAGKFGYGDTDITDDVKTVKTRKTGSTDLNMNFIEEISFSAENAAYCGAPLVFGYNEAYKAFKALQASNCCADNGTNLALLNDIAGTFFIPNRNITAAFGSANNFLTIDAGAIQVLKYNRYLGPDGGIDMINEGTAKRTVVVHPAYGIPFDLKMDFSCGNWHIFVSLAFKTVGMPDDMYYTGDIYEGVTGINKFVIANS
jgi:hypothetical protein